MKQLLNVKISIFIIVLFMSCNRQNKYFSVVKSCLLNNSNIDTNSIIYLWNTDNDSVKVTVNDYLVYKDYVSDMVKDHGNSILSFYVDQGQQYVRNCKKTWQVSNPLKIEYTIGNSNREQLISLDTVRTIMLYYDKRNNYIEFKTLNEAISFK